MRERVAVAGGRLVPLRHPRHVCGRVGERMHHVAECQQRPARAGRRHLGLEGVALGLRRDRIGGPVHGKDRGLDVAVLGGLRGRKRAVHGHDRLHIGAGACEIEDIEPAEAKTHGRAPGDVADRPPVGLPRQGVERGRDAAPHSRDIRHERLEELHGILGPDRAVAFAEHVRDEDHIALARQHLGGFDRRLDDASPVGRHQQQRPGRLDALVPDQRAAATDAGRRIEDALDRHRFLRNGTRNPHYDAATYAMR